MGDINQDGDNNNSRVQQGNNMQAEDNKAYVDQIGNYNRADVLQRWDNNYSDVNQTGDHNRVKIEQAARPDQSLGNKSTITQSGNYNSADSYQETVSNYPGPGYSNIEIVSQSDDDNYSKLHQVGDYNRSEVTQSGNYGTTFSGGSSNWASVDQSGEKNKSHITQDDAGVAAGLADNWAKVTQTQSGAAPGNVSHIDQHGANTATVTQHNP